MLVSTFVAMLQSSYPAMCILACGARAATMAILHCSGAKRSAVPNALPAMFVRLSIYHTKNSYNASNLSLRPTVIYSSRSSSVRDRFFLALPAIARLKASREIPPPCTLPLLLTLALFCPLPCSDASPGCGLDARDGIGDPTTESLPVSSSLLLKKAMRSVSLENDWAREPAGVTSGVESGVGRGVGRPTGWVMTTLNISVDSSHVSCSFRRSVIRKSGRSFSRASGGWEVATAITRAPDCFPARMPVGESSITRAA